MALFVFQNTFQAVLATDGVDSFIVYNYFDINWPDVNTSNSFPQVENTLKILVHTLSSFTQTQHARSYRLVLTRVTASVL